MDALMFFEPRRGCWTRRREIGGCGPQRFWDPWADFAEMDGGVWRPWVRPSAVEVQRRQNQRQEQTETKPEPAGFRVALDAAGYRPQEVSVNVSDGVVTVRAEHQEMAGGDLVSSSLVRRVRLPDGVREDALTARLTRAGQLVLEAPLAASAAPALQQEKPAAVTQAAKTAQETSGGPADEAKAADAADAGSKPAAAKVVDGPQETSTAVRETQEEQQYRVSVSVKDFQPQEISVRVHKGVVTVEALHEDTSEGGLTSLRLLKKFVLPPDVNPDLVTSRLTQAGQLILEAPRGRTQAVAQKTEAQGDAKRNVKLETQQDAEIAVEKEDGAADPWAHKN